MLLKNREHLFSHPSHPRSNNRNTRAPREKRRRKIIKGAWNELQSWNMDTKKNPHKKPLANPPHHHNHLKNNFHCSISTGTKYIALFNSNFNVLTTVLSWSRIAITIYMKLEAADRKKGFHGVRCKLMKREWGRNKATFKLLYVSINQAIHPLLIAHYRHNILMRVWQLYSPCDSTSEECIYEECIYKSLKLWATENPSLLLLCGYFLIRHQQKRKRTTCKTIVAISFSLPCNSWKYE